MARFTIAVEHVPDQSSTDVRNTSDAIRTSRSAQLVVIRRVVDNALVFVLTNLEQSVKLVALQLLNKDQSASTHIQRPQRRGDQHQWKINDAQSQLLK